MGVQNINLLILWISLVLHYLFLQTKTIIITVETIQSSNE
jgi:hypothetical protein